MKVKASAVLLPTLTVLSASLQAADVTPSWVEYTPVSASPASAVSVSTPVAASQPATVAATTTTTGDTAATMVAAGSTPTETGTPAVTAGVATVGTATAESGAGELTMSTVVTPRLYAFDYFKGNGQNLPHYLERYDYREGFNGDTRSGIYGDVDLNLTITSPGRDVFVLERQGFGANNHRGSARFDDEEVTLSGSYSHYRSATGGIDYLYSPGMVPGAEVGAGDFQFFDRTGTTEYKIDRTTYSASFKVKPTLLNGITLGVDYQGYKREGNQLATSIVNLDEGPPAVRYWSGINYGVDERMNKLALTLAASPAGWFNITYTGALEKFTNNAADLTNCNDFLAGTGHCGGTPILDASRQGLAPFYFVPDTTLWTHELRLSKPIGERTLVAAGYSFSNLEQDNFPERFTTYGDPYNNGEINSQSAYLSAKTNLASGVGVEGYIKYYQRDNDSSFPVQHVIANSGANQRMTGPRINSIDSMDYGLSANWRANTLSSNFTLGWQRIDRDRDLTYRTTGEGIPANRILYHESTLSDEIYLKWMARPAPGWNLRVTPSYLWADDTGLVTEPEKSIKLKTMLSYAAPAGWLVTGFYDYKDTENNNLSFTSSGGAVTQQAVDTTFHSAGVTFNVLPWESISTGVSLFWMQNDLQSYYFDTTAPRNDPAAVFNLNGLSGYKVNSYVLSLNADWHASSKLKLAGSYAFSVNKGDTASGAVLAELQAATGTVDSLVDNKQHSLSLGADYSLSPKTTLRTQYI